MANYLMIDEGGIVQNCCEWDGVTPFPVPAGWTLAEPQQGEYYEFGQPRGIEPPPLPEPPPPAPTNEQTVIYEHENRIRVLEGQPPLSLADFVVKASQPSP